jgi:hypothetical protein
VKLHYLKEFAIDLSLENCIFLLYLYIHTSSHKKSDPTQDLLELTLDTPDLSLLEAVEDAKSYVLRFLFY